MGVKKVLEVTKATHRLFKEDDKLRPDAETFLSDLILFCHGMRTSVKVGPDGKIDTNAMLIAEGRREVLLRLLKTLEVDTGQMIRLERILAERTGEQE